MKLIKIEGKDFETEIEQYFIRNGADEDIMAYDAVTFGAQAFRGYDEKVEWIKNNCIVFEDEENIYVAQKDWAEDYKVQVCPKTKEYTQKIMERLASDDADSTNSTDEGELIVEFEVISKKDTNISIKGYMDVEDADDEKPLNFYTVEGFEAGAYVPSNPFDEEKDFKKYDEYELISSEFQSDVLFIQFITDFAGEDKLVDRGDYLLKINNGAILTIEITNYEDINKDYQVRVIPKFNGEPAELNDTVFFEDPYTYEETLISDIIYDDGYIVEFPKSYFEGDDCDNIIKEYTTAFEKAFVQSK